MKKIAISRIAGNFPVVLICALMVGLLQTLSAQDRFSLQFRPGVSFATKDLGDAKLQTGFGFEVIGAYRFMPHMSAYVGWGWNRFSSGQSFAGTETDFEETGYVLGLQFVHPIHDGVPFDYFLRAGAIYNHIEAENAEGDIFADSGHGFGYQIETGLSFSLGKSWSLLPGIKYQSLSGKLDIEGISHAIDLNYLSVGATISKTF